MAKTAAVAVSLLAALAIVILVFGPRVNPPEDRARNRVRTMAEALDTYVRETGRWPVHPAARGAGGENAFPALFEAIFMPRGEKDPIMTAKEADILVRDDDLQDYRRADPEEIWDPKTPKYLADPWWTPYVYIDSGRKLIFSCGRDRLPGTADDIGSR